MKNAIAKLAGLYALAATLYVAAVATFLFHGPRALGMVKSPLVPMAMLLLLVCSAALMGLLIFGRPVMWYLDGKKKEALSLLFSTLGILFCLMLATFFILIRLSK